MKDSILKTAESILKSKNNFDPGQYDKMLSKAESLGIEAVTLTDEGYPLQLKEIYDPPVILYYKGLNGNSAEALKKLQADSVGIVGTRTHEVTTRMVKKCQRTLL